MDYKIYEAIKYHRMGGRPEIAARIERLDAEGEPIPPQLLNTSGVNPEKEIERLDELTPPPRQGTGSSKKAWALFAKKVSSIEPSVLKALSRDGIIAVLEKDGIIPKETDGE